MFREMLGLFSAIFRLRDDKGDESGAPVNRQTNRMLVALLTRYCLTAQPEEAVVDDQ